VANGVPRPQGIAWDKVSLSLFVYNDTDERTTTLAFHAGHWSEFRPAHYPNEIVAVVGDTTHRRLLVVGAPLASISQTPDTWTRYEPARVFAWSASDWHEITWSELNATP
jgi:hypothetical protein